MSFNKYFNDIFCINLDHRPNRWDDVQKEFNKFNLTGVTRFSAVDGKTLPKPHALLDGELGVLESNLKLVKYANENNLPNFLMLEDDVVFSDEVNNLDKYMSNIPDDWDMIYLDLNNLYIPDFHNTYGGWVNGYNDRFAISNRDNMRTYLNIVESISPFVRQGGELHGETFLKWHLKINQINVKLIPVRFTRVRTNGEEIDKRIRHTSSWYFDEWGRCLDT